MLAWPEQFSAKFGREMEFEGYAILGLVEYVPWNCRQFDGPRDHEGERCTARYRSLPMSQRRRRAGKPTAPRSIGEARLGIVASYLEPIGRLIRGPHHVARM